MPPSVGRQPAHAHPASTLQPRWHSSPVTSVTLVHRSACKSATLADEHCYRLAHAQADSDLPPFLYGSHYSSAGAVLFYLMRLEPFAGLARMLQARAPAARAFGRPTPGSGRCT